MEKKSSCRVFESDIIASVNDFVVFCKYIEVRKPKLSKQKEVFGKNDLFELNKLLHFKKEVAAPNYMQESYPVIDLMFKLAVLGKLYMKTGDLKGNVYFEPTARLLEFNELNNFEKYSFLFETFWTRFDFSEIFGCKDDTVDQIIKVIFKSSPGKKLMKGAFSRRKDFDPVFSYDSVLIYYFSYFGFCTFESIPFEPKKFSKYEDNIKVVIPSELGVNMCEVMVFRNLADWNIPWMEEFGNFRIWDEEEEDIDKGIEEDDVMPLHKYFEPIFPEGVLSNSVKSETKKVVEGNYIFQVSLEKNVWRKIKVSFKHTLEHLHLAIQKAFDFDNDHLYAFFMDGKRYSRNAYHSPNGDEEPYADEAVIGELGLYVGKRILYFFDYGDSWEFTAQLIAIDEHEPAIKKPKIIEEKGEAPDQYPDYDDFDFEDE